MSQTASAAEFIPVDQGLMVAFELGWRDWRLAFGTAMGVTRIPFASACPTAY
jgi:hypothetical protein